MSILQMWQPEVLKGQASPPSNWPVDIFFKPAEFRCRQTGRYPQMTKEVEYFLCLCSTWREQYGKPMVVTSGYRHPSHFIERKKTFPGAHAHGVAVDIVARTGRERFLMLSVLFDVLDEETRPLCGLGISAKSKPFIHFDLWGKDGQRPTVWTY